MNRSILRWLSAAALSGVVVATLSAPATPAAAAPGDPAAFCADGTQPMVPQAEAVDFAAGTPVTGLTVVQGTQPVTFTGRYTGSVQDALGKGADMLLFELSGAGIDSGSPRAGIWAGMSGSPVYAQDGRLIGAVAYGLNADNLPIAGVTPAEYMKRTGHDQLTPARIAMTRSSLVGTSRATESRLAGQSLPRLKTLKVVAGSPKANALANRTLKRVPGTSSVARFARDGGFASVATPSTIADPLVPGGNIAVGYATGDLFNGGVGTVTAICGSTVWAFGHPMTFEGETQLSMHNASAALIVPDSTGTVGSFKQVSRIGQQVGTVTYDGYGAVRGEIGRITGFPVTTNVYNANGTRLATYGGSVVNRDIASFAAGYAGAVASMDILDNSGTGTARLVWRIGYKLPNGRTGTLTNSDVYAGMGELADYLVSGVGNDVASLLETDLANATITSIRTDLTLLSAKAISYRNVGAQRWNGKAWVRLHGTTVKPGGSLTVRPVYREYVNGRPQGTRTGPSQKVTLWRTARGTAEISYSPSYDEDEDEDEYYEEECRIDTSGNVVCTEFGYSEEDRAPRTFSELVAQLDAYRSADRGRMTAAWQWRSKYSKGVKERETTAVAPGVVFGTYTASVRVRR